MLLKMMLAAALAFAPFTAMAAQPYVEIEQRLTVEQLREVGLTGEQLAKLNRMLGEQAATAVDTAGPGDQFEQDRAGQGRLGQGGRSLIGLEDGPIKSRLKGSVSGWQPGTVFVLENGQQWKVLKGSMKLSKPLQAPEVVVVPGIAGRWFLQVDEDLPKARVYRID